MNMNRKTNNGRRKIHVMTLIKLLVPSGWSTAKLLFALFFLFLLYKNFLKSRERERERERERKKEKLSILIHLAHQLSNI